MHVFIVNSFDNRPGELRQNNIKVHGNIKSSELSTRGVTSEEILRERTDCDLTP